MKNILSLIGRDKSLFDGDITENAKQLGEMVKKKSSFLVIGGLVLLAGP